MTPVQYYRNVAVNCEHFQTLFAPTQTSKVFKKRFPKRNTLRNNFQNLREKQPQ